MLSILQGTRNSKILFYCDLCECYYKAINCHGNVNVKQNEGENMVAIMFVIITFSNFHSARLYARHSSCFNMNIFMLITLTMIYKFNVNVELEKNCAN